MEKTSIRYNNRFILKKNTEYYLTDIDILDDWNNESELSELRIVNINDKIKSLIEKYNISEKVNFIDDSEIKIIPMK